VIDMGRKSAAVSEFLAPAGCVLASIAWLGTAGITNDVLIRSATGPHRTGAASLRNQTGSLSSPVAVGRNVSSILNAL